MILPERIQCEICGEGVAYLSHIKEPIIINMKEVIALQHKPQYKMLDVYSYKCITCGCSYLDTDCTMHNTHLIREARNETDDC